MKIKFSLCAVLLLASTAGAAVRLGVVVVVDQMRPEYLDRSDLPEGGFRRLRREGAVFTQARHLHVPTETAPGHAALSTGRSPAVHGIIGNDWYDRVAGSTVSCVGDAAYGIGPEHLQGPTLADALKAREPKARVFAISGKDRGAVIMGGRKADLALWFDRSKGEFTTSSYYRRPSWLAAFNARLKTSGPLAHKDGKFQKQLVASPAFDAALELLLNELAERELVGRGPGTDLLSVSFSGTDYVGHTYGLEVPEMDAQLKSLDAILGRLLARLEKASGGSLALALSSDHGAIPAPEDASGAAAGVRRVGWAAFESALEAALQAQWPLKDARWITANHLPDLYLNLSAAEALDLERHAFLVKAAKVLSAADGIAAVVVPGAKGTPFDDQLRRSYNPSRSGDLLAVTKQNVLFHDKPRGTSHGSPWDYDARVPLVFWGRGTRAGTTDAAVSTMDVAPTLAHLLGFDYPAGEDSAVRPEALAK